MGPVALAIHLGNLILPALAVAMLVTLAGRLLFPGSGGIGRGWQFAANASVGIAVLLLGLWWFGRDGKTATYAALVLAVATSQWVLARGWRR